MKRVKKLVLAVTGIALSVSLAAPAWAAQPSQRVPLRDTTPYVSTTCDRFTDVPADHWGRDGISYAVDKGLFNGTSATTFNPDGTMSRAMLCTVLYRFGGSPAVSGESGYRDVESGSWYADGVAWARENKLLPAGLLDAEGLSPQDGMTRAEFALMLHNFRKYDSGTSGKIDWMPGVAVTFPDIPRDYSVAQAMSWAYTYNILNGTSENTMSPDMEVTRAQAAAILERYNRQFSAEPLTSGNTGDQDNAGDQSVESVEDELIRLINDYRAENGLPRLTKNDKLMEAADIRVEEIAIKFEHTRLDGSNPVTVLNDVGITSLDFTKENIAKEVALFRGASAQSAFNSWKHSTGHNQAMLTHAPVTDIAVGIYTAPDGVIYYEMLFAGNLSGEWVS